MIWFNKSFIDMNVGNLFTLDEWIDLLKTGAINRYDGSGYWATETQHFDEGDIFDINTKPRYCTHIMWFNK